jgi:hypothetical protein
MFVFVLILWCTEENRNFVVTDHDMIDRHARTCGFPGDERCERKSLTTAAALAP